MFDRIKKLALALSITFGTTAVTTVGTSIAMPAPAEAGIVSSIKGAAKSTVKYAVGGVTHVAKTTANSAKQTTKSIVVPTAKKFASIVANVAKPVGKILKKIVLKPGPHLSSKTQ